jgi:hypothetical protein
MSQPLQASGKIPVFGRGDNPVNFVSAIDVALAELAVTDPGLRGRHTLSPERLASSGLTGGHRAVIRASACPPGRRIGHGLARDPQPARYTKRPFAGTWVPLSRTAYGLAAGWVLG